jgi:hypothetical protein
VTPDREYAEKDIFLWKRVPLVRREIALIFSTEVFQYL